MDLAQRAVACKHWRWLPGMLAVGPGTSTRVRPADRAPFFEYLEPDLGDPATLGCLRALVLKAWGEYAWEIAEDYTGASFDVLDPSDASRNIVSFIEEGRGALARVLVAALEAAPSPAVSAPITWPGFYNAPIPPRLASIAPSSTRAVIARRTWR